MTLSRRALLGLGAATSLLAACGTQDRPAANSKPRNAGGTRTAGPADGPGVLLLHAWWGVTPGVLAWARTLGDAGARVLVPDLYDGKVAASVEEAQRMADSLDDATVAEKLDESAATLAEGGEWGALGWSLGAFHTSQLMTHPHAPARAVLFYGGAPLQGPTTTTRVQLHVVPDDQYFTAEEIDATLTSLQSAEVDVQRFDYPGLGHWFAEPGSPAYDAQGFALATSRAQSFLGL